MIGVLKITNAQNNDIGNYLVLAENPLGKDQTFCKLFVNPSPNVDETPLIDPDAFKFLEPSVKPDNNNDEPYKKDRERFFPPRVIIPLTNQIINEGDLVRLAAKIDGYPKPKVFINSSSHLKFEEKLNEIIKKYKDDLVQGL